MAVCASLTGGTDALMRPPSMKEDVPFADAAFAVKIVDIPQSLPSGLSGGIFDVPDRYLLAGFDLPESKQVGYDARKGHRSVRITVVIAEGERKVQCQIAMLVQPEAVPLQLGAFGSLVLRLDGTRSQSRHDLCSDDRSTDGFCLCCYEGEGG
jgi:hypothetical protein